MWKCSPEAQVRLRTLIAVIILRMGSGPDKIDPPPLLTAWCTAGARAPVTSLSRNGVLVRLGRSHLDVKLQLGIEIVFTGASATSRADS